MIGIDNSSISTLPANNILSAMLWEPQSWHIFALNSLKYPTPIIFSTGDNICLLMPVLTKILEKLPNKSVRTLTSINMISIPPDKLINGQISGFRFFTIIEAKHVTNPMAIILTISISPHQKLKRFFTESSKFCIRFNTIIRHITNPARVVIDAISSFPQNFKT